MKSGASAATIMNVWKSLPIRSLKLHIPNVYTADQFTDLDHPHGRHAMTKLQAKGMEVTPAKKASVLEIMGLAGHLGHVVFIFFISAKQQAKQKVAKSQVVCRGLWLDC